MTAEQIAAGLTKATWTACQWSDTKAPKYRLQMDEERFIFDAGEGSESLWIDFADMAEVIAMLQCGLEVRRILQETPND